jgi:carbonic anhydrase/acetyltransferase-like protein (isoleucine patch superfamily)
MIDEKKLVFNQYFFKHALESNPKSKILGLLIKLYKIKAFVFILYLFERLASFILSLRIPIYSDIMLSFITNLPGFPRMLGCYIRGLYYKNKLKKMESNVIIEQGAIISYPEQVELSEFSLIDKYVIIAANTAIIGRRVHLAPYVVITGGGNFIIEDYACMASGAKAITSTETLKPNTRSSGPMIPRQQRDVLKGLVHIKKDAFVAVNVVILTNTVIEEGVVLTSGVVASGVTQEWTYYVTKDSHNKPVRTQRVMGRKKLDLPDV